MVDVCFYFQVHQPYRLRKFGVFDIGTHANYFDTKKNINILKKVAAKCYIPSNRLMLYLIKQHPEFKVSYSLSGIFMDQCRRYAPEVLDSFKELADTGNVEFLDETYHHSLSFLYSQKEFMEQVALHRKQIQTYFGQTPKVFRNTELVFNNELAHVVEGMGYKGILAEGADHILGWRSPNYVYRPKTTTNMALLLKNYKLSDDIAFRFSSHDWKEFPLTAEKFARWVSAVNGNGTNVNLFMDYETIGEHQWACTGIFDFMKALPGEILKHPDNAFMTPSEVIAAHKPVAELDIHHFISWADVERDLSAWLGNNMQTAAMYHIFALEQQVKATNDPGIIELWRKLTTSDNFYYMCTKWFADGDVHKYFNPHDRPHDAFISFMNILTDLQIRIKKKEVKPLERPIPAR